MNLLDLVNQAGGGKSLGDLAGVLALSPSKVDDLVSALSPALLDGIKKQAAPEGGLAGLQSALQDGGHRRYLEDSSLMSAASSVADGDKILGHLFGDKQVSRTVAAEAAESTGIDASLIKKALPLLAGLAMGAVGKAASSGQSLDSSLPALLGKLSSSGGVSLDTVLGLAKKLF